jgi:hypothetical protein
MLEVGDLVTPNRSWDQEEMVVLITRVEGNNAYYIKNSEEALFTTDRGFYKENNSTFWKVYSVNKKP